MLVHYAHMLVTHVSVRYAQKRAFSLDHTVNLACVMCSSVAMKKKLHQIVSQFPNNQALTRAFLKSCYKK